MSKPRQENVVESDQPRAAWKNALAPLILVLTATLAYHNSLDAPFIFDDVLNIKNNQQLRRLSPIWKTMWGPLGTGVSGRPVVQLSFALNYAVHGLEVRGYHVVNLLLHIGTSVLLFTILRRMFTSSRLAGRLGEHATWLALVAAAVWQVHPLLSDSVTYIAGRTEILAAFFMLSTLYCAIRVMGSTPHARLWLIAAIVFYIIDTGCKEIAAATPFLVLLYDRLFISESYREAFGRRRWLYVALFACVVFIPLNLCMAEFHVSALKVRDSMSSWDYLKVQSEVLTLYLRLSVWPHPLIIDYADWPKHPSLVSVLPNALFIASLLFIVVFGLLRRWPAAYAGAWFFLILGPTSSVLPLPTEIVTERRMYLPLMAIVALGAVGGYRLAQLVVSRFPKTQRLVHTGGAIALVSLIGAEVQRTLWRNEDYKNPIGLWSDVINHRPYNVRAYDNLAYEFLIRGNDAAAKACFYQGVQINPYNTTGLNNLATILMREGNYDQAIGFLEQAVRVQPDYGSALLNLGSSHSRKGEFDQAEKYLREAVRLQPGRVISLVTLAQVRLAQGDATEAEQLARTALKIDPNTPDAQAVLMAVDQARRSPR